MNSRPYIISSEQLDSINERLEEILKQTKLGSLAPEHIIHTETDVLEILNISNSTLKLWRKEGKISYSKMGQQIYYTHKDIIDFIESHRVKKNSG